MKRLNALALCAAMAPVYALGIGSVMAAEHDNAAATQQEASQSLAGEDNPGRSDAASAATAEARDAGASAEMQKDESQDLGEPYTAQQGETESVTGEGNPGRNDTLSTGTAEALEGSSTAAARGEETEQTGEPYAAARDAKRSGAEEGDPAMNETASGAPAKAAEGSGMVDAANEEAQELGGTDSADMAAGDRSGDAEPAFHAADLIGRDVTSRNDDAKIGSISDLVFGADGRILSVIVGVGGFLGMGDKDVAIAWSEVERKLNADGDGYVISVDRDSQSLRDATAYDRSLAHSTSIN